MIAGSKVLTFPFAVLLLGSCASVQIENTAVPTEPLSVQQLQVAPLYARERVTKKPFGIYITPENSPVSPERFRGYHTGVDFEVLPEEEQSAVPVLAICSGNVLFKRWVNGYGGVLIQQCALPNFGDVTVLYGHLDVDSIHKNSRELLNTGDFMGNLGAGFSEQTDYERKHLHLAVHKGITTEFRGYVQNSEALNNWIDPLLLLQD